ncbi:MAG: SPFH domain-containing protein [bacterium]|nr:SPFH domain-containing protein [Candidatus Sumerlaeota bacterium]
MPPLMEVLEFLDNTDRVMVRRVPENGECEIKWGAQLTVRESQKAVFFRDGKALDVFGPGRYVLETQNIPVVAKWVTEFAYGPASPFRSEVYFISMKLFPNLKWGTREPIIFRDKELKMIRLRAHGIFSIQIADPVVFLNKIVGTRQLYTDIEIEDYLRGIIITRLTDALGTTLKTVFDLPQDFSELSIVIRTELGPDFDGLGLKLHDFYLNSIALPPEVQQMIDTRAGMAAVGNLDDFMRFKVAMALETAAANPSGLAAAGTGMGAGLGMGVMMPQFIQQALAQPPREPAREEDPMTKIRKLKELLDLGAISQAEFGEKKKKLLEAI